MIDLNLRLGEKYIIDIEMNKTLYTYVRARNDMYYHKFVTLQVTVGDNYKNVEQLVIFQLNLNASEKEKLDEPDHKFVTCDEYDNKKLYDDSINATIYSKDNLILEGDGTLIVNSNNKNAIVSCNNLIINDGTYKINASIDALKGKDSVIIKNGNFEIKSNDDGIHADNELLIDNGTINIVRSYEGLEAEKIIINDEDIKVYSSDDVINTSSKSDNLATINIKRGNVYVNSSGDGLDANSSIYISGGIVTFDGPTTDGDVALDYDNELVITKGISNTSSQYGVLINFDKTYQNDSVTTITNSNNEEIMSYTSTKNFSSLCYSNSNLVNGESYPVKINGETVESLLLQKYLIQLETLIMDLRICHQTVIEHLDRESSKSIFFLFYYIYLFILLNI